MANRLMRGAVLLAVVVSVGLALSCGGGGTGSSGNGDGNGDQPTKMTLANVEYWAYNIQNVDTQAQRDELVGTHFDMYILELVVTEKGNEDFDMASDRKSVV